MRARFAALTVLVVMALAALGVAYAYWTEPLTINGTVSTGDIDAWFANLAVHDGDYGQANGGDCSATLSADKQTITLAITNAYHSYQCKVQFIISNYGSVPAQINGVTVSGDVDPSGDLLQVALSGVLTGQNWPVGYGPFPVDIPMPSGSVSGDVVIHVGNVAPISNYVATVTINTTQFNNP